MSARAPEAIQKLWADVDKAIPRAQLGGIVGDSAHGFGYHLARRDLPTGDYSRQLSADLKGAGDCASALDVTLPADLMLTCTRRLHAAAVNNDPRLSALREFCGTLDGRQTFPWDLSSNTSEGLGSWDDSHLWHIHLSFYRQFADNYAALAPIADVLAGTPLAKELTVMDDDTKKYLDDRFDSLERKFLGTDGKAHTVESAVAHVTQGAGYVGGKGRRWFGLMRAKDTK